jgi:Flp pilus assembly protein TadG
MRAPPGLLARFWRARGGLAAVEFALVLPIAAAVLFGEFVLGEALSINRKIAIASRTVADLVARNMSIERYPVVPAKPDLASIMNASMQIAAPFANAGMGIVVAELKTDAALKTTVTWSAAQNTTALTKGAVVTLPAGMAVADTSLIFTAVNYAYTPPVGQNVFGTIPISSTFYMPPRVSSFIKCNGC